jgi:CubicO group peptidase (beta-lactamase class C family)/D-alanyl-D-alanine dipeptidase
MCALLAALVCTACGRVETSYPELTAALAATIEHELDDKGIPGLSIALVDGDEVVWAEGFGMADAESGVPATAETVYRVGSVSKLFTDIAAMQLVERGEIDLDRPVAEYLPDFQPQNPFDKSITLRQLTSHRSGLVREPPVGHYFDATSPTLEATVASLNDTELVYEPETRTKYSNAGIAVIGRLLEHTQGQPFADYLSAAVLEPMGLNDSAFELKETLRPRLAKAVMWSYDGREFPAPTFELGIAPAGSMYTTVLDMARFMHVLFQNGEAADGPVIRPETLETMFTPQFAEPGATTGFGIGFDIGELDGHTRYGHGGAIYGFATTLAFLHEEQLGVVVVANMDIVNSVTGRIATMALEMMLARREGRRLPAPTETGPIDPELTRELDGLYSSDENNLELIERDGHLFGCAYRRCLRLRAKGESDLTLIADSRLGFGITCEVGDDGAITVRDERFEPQGRPRPAPSPPRFHGLIGEYGWDHNVLFIFERDGLLHALIEWIEIDPLTELDENVFAFPEEGGFYEGEQLVFERDAGGRATAVVAAGISFPRRRLQGEEATTFRIQPVRPVEELRREALAATPPDEEGSFQESELTEINSLDPSIKLDIRYASTNNFMGARFYDEPRAFMQRPAAEAVVRVHQALAEQGYGLLIHDAYRPWYVTRMFWDATPEESKLFVADPTQGSRHNRGCAVDLTLFNLATGAPVEMVGLYDEFSERSYPDYVGGTSLARWHRELLRDAMEAEGFRVYEYEWWHFDFRDWERYRIENRVFDEIAP